MDTITIIAIIVSITAGFGFINTKLIKLPNTIGLMLLSIVFSILLGLLCNFFPVQLQPLVSLIKGLDFSKVVFEILLSFLLFAGALHTDFNLLHNQRVSVILFALVGVLIATFLIGITLYFTASMFGHPIPMVYCLLFGSIISPTDPIAVLGILTKANLPKKLEINIVGESLFNDGIAIVVFVTILQVASQSSFHINITDIGKVFLIEAIGGISFGALVGVITFYAIKVIDDYESELLITIAAVMGGSVLANYLHVSGPLAMVVAGLITGYKTREQAMTSTTTLYIDKFWHLVDVLLNAVLFVLMGLKILSIPSDSSYIPWLLVLIPLLILIRFISLYLPFAIAQKYLSLKLRDIKIMTWGGLRGGLSIAMALALSDDIKCKPEIVALTYGIVFFSIFVQGLTIERLAKRLYQTDASS